MRAGVVAIVWENWDMQDTEKPDRELLDALGLCGGSGKRGAGVSVLGREPLRLLWRWVVR